MEENTPRNVVTPIPARYMARPLWVTIPLGLLRFARSKPLGAAGGVVMLLMIVAAITAPIISPYDPLEVHPGDRLTAPLTISKSGAVYPLGSDDIGRDILSRVIYGARTALMVGILALFFGTTTGTMLGICSAYFGGRFDLLVQRYVDAQQAFPLLIFAMAIVSVLGQSMVNVIGAIAIILIPGLSRVIRGTSLSIMENQYIDAARAIGAGHRRIIFLHILPNVAPVIIILASIQLGTTIIVEATLSFLGLGTPPPAPSWGGMLAGSGRRFLEIAPWLALVPGTAISLAVLGINLLGDALRDVLDPRLRGT